MIYKTLHYPTSDHMSYHFLPHLLCHMSQIVFHVVYEHIKLMRAFVSLGRYSFPMPLCGLSLLLI